MIDIVFRLLASSSASVACPDDAGGSCTTGLPIVSATSGQLHNVLTIFFGIAAAISVLMIIIGGIKFVTSGGNSQDATKARETIIYALIGLVVSLAAEAIVAFVIGKI